MNNNINTLHSFIQEEAILEAVFTDIFKWLKKSASASNTTIVPKSSRKTTKAKLSPRTYIDSESKEIVIQGINFRKFISRLKEMYKYRGILNLFDRKFSTWEMNLWYKELITKDKMHIIELRVPLFFALELYKIFQDLYEFYRYAMYQSIANDIYNNTWISNFEEIAPTYTNLSNLSRISYELKDYQAEFIRQYSALKQLYNLDGYILSFEQGLGKTLTAIGLAECLDKDQIIIICPNSLKENWANEIKMYYKKYNTKNNKSLYNDIYISNNKTFNAKNPKFIITNQENIPAIFSVVKPNKNTIIIVDECHNFRNINAERVKNLIKLKELIDCKDNLLMSGTPIKATPDELAPALRMIDPYFTPEVCARYIKSFNTYSEEISRVVKERFSRIIYKQTKDQVLQLPEKNVYQAFLPVKHEEQFYVSTIRKQIAYDFNKEYELLYKDLAIYKDRFESIVNQYSSAPKVDTRTYLNYLAGDINFGEYREELYRDFIKQYVYPNIEDPNILKELKEMHTKYVYMYNSAMGRAIGKNLPPARANCYIALLDENISFFVEKINSNPKKTVIFTPFLDVANHTSEVLSSNGINNVLITGGTKDRFTLITEFKESDVIEVLVATTQTLNTGVTLVEADQMFFLGVPYRDADFEQACDRIHRIGQTTDVNIYIILLKSKQENVSTRIEKIMSWSADATSDFLDI